MRWYYKGVEVTELPNDCVGYVYCIENLTNDRKYIGKKLAKFSKTTYKVEKLKNGKKRRRKIRSKVDSDWQEYWSSSIELKNDIASLGTENFKREILFYCKSKSECTYIEARTQFERKVLESDEYYNGQISCRIHQSHIKGKI